MAEILQIFFVYAPDCQKCSEMLGAIENAIKKSKTPCEVLKFDYTINTKVAVNMAINNNVCDLPFCVVPSKMGNSVFTKDNFSEEKITEAIKKRHE